LWFQQELPYPDIDLGALKGSSSDVFPLEFADKVMVNGNYERAEFFRQYERRIETNFTCLEKDHQEDYERRRLAALKIKVEDFATHSHILMQFMSKIAS